MERGPVRGSMVEIFLAGEEGIEPSTFGLEDRCSIR